MSIITDSMAEKAATAAKMSNYVYREEIRTALEAVADDIIEACIKEAARHGAHANDRYCGGDDGRLYEGHMDAVEAIINRLRSLKSNTDMSTGTFADTDNH